GPAARRLHPVPLSPPARRAGPPRRTNDGGSTKSRRQETGEGGGARSIGAAPDDGDTAAAGRGPTGRAEAQRGRDQARQRREVIAPGGWVPLSDRPPGGRS